MNGFNDDQPYKATRLWNEVIIAFRTGMPLKRHRYRIRYYDNCFTAADCISWLNCYLKNNPNFGPHVTRQQTIQLLQKFLKSQVIESAVSKNSKIEFKDNINLYKFIEYTPPKVQKTSPLQALLRTPLSIKNSNRLYYNEGANINDSFQFEPKLKNKFNKENFKPRVKSAECTTKNIIPECHIVERRLGVTEIENIWKNIALHKLECLLSPARIEDLIDVNEISGKIIRHSSSKISKSGVVVLIDKTDDIPHWVISAMKCLANWPKASGTGSCLPNYPGFEKDVFKVVKDYFLNPREVLILPSLQTLIDAAVRHILNIKLKDVNESKSLHENSPFNRMHSSPQTSTPLDNNHIQLNINSISDVNIRSTEGQLILNDSEAIWENPLNAFYETEFYKNSPVTRIVQNPSLSSKHSLSSLTSNDTLKCESIGTLSTLSACSRMTKLSKCTISQSCQHLMDAKDKTFNCTKKSNLNDTFTNSLEKSLNLTFIDSLIVDQNSSMDLYLKASQKNENKNFSNDFQICNNSKIAVGKMCKPLCENHTSHFEFKTQSLCNIFEFNGTDDKIQSKELTPNISKLNENTSCNFEIFSTTVSQSSGHQELLSRFKEALQIILLFLPLSNRRQLHLLLRMINKILQNNELVLDIDITTKDYLLDTFLPAVMKFDISSQLHKKYAYNLFYYMVKECETILRPPEVVKEEAHFKITALQRRMIKYSLDDISLTYCELISRQQYEKQKLSSSKQALADLLDAILLDEKASEKEKRKKLKQFKENYPDIIKQKFPNPEELQHLFVKPKKPLLSKLLNLRM